LERIDWEDAALRDLEPSRCCISDFEIKLIKGEYLEREIELLDDGTLGFQVILICPKILQNECDRSCGLRFVNNFVLRGGHAAIEE
jgi:hypothetical protein